jgi:hypothetical protein
MSKTHSHISPLAARTLLTASSHLSIIFSRNGYLASKVIHF